MSIRRAVDVADAVLRRYAGRFQLKADVVFDIKLVGSVLAGQGELPLFPASETRFFYRLVAAEIEFQLEDGEVTGLVLHQGGIRQSAKRITTGEKGGRGKREGRKSPETPCRPGFYFAAMQ